MKIVTIYKLEAGGSQHAIATCRLVGNEAVCEGESAFVASLLRDGIHDYKGGKERLFLKDGLLFLEQLSFNFSSGYLNASKVEDF